MDSGQTRQRMRPWLESKVESGQIPGLAWIDREKKIFRVPWKHGGKHDWNEADSTIFKVIKQGLECTGFRCRELECCTRNFSRWKDASLTMFIVIFW